MKSKPKQTQSTRKHGLSRLEKLLQAFIRQELQIKALRRDLCALSVRIGQIEHCPAIESDIHPGAMEYRCHPYALFWNTRGYDAWIMSRKRSTCLGRELTLSEGIKLCEQDAKDALQTQKG